MTRILVLSDLHLDHRPAWSMPASFPPYDVAVFAGDVDGSVARSVRRLAESPALAGRPSILVPGNHEFYGGEVEERLAEGREACAGTDVNLLDRDSVVLEGVQFTGATLWTDYKLFGDAVAGMAACGRALNDHRLIRVGGRGAERRFLPRDAAARHAADSAFLEEALSVPFAGPRVVVTHHAPHRGSVAARFARNPLTAGFVSDLSDLIGRRSPALWVHGHVHDGFDYPVGTTRVLANPKGYGPGRTGSMPENPRFNGALVVEV